jgi:hypothetical protein
MVVDRRLGKLTLVMRDFSSRAGWGQLSIKRQTVATLVRRSRPRRDASSDESVADQRRSLKKLSRAAPCEAPKPCRKHCAARARPPLSPNVVSGHGGSKFKPIGSLLPRWQRLE